MIAEKYTASLDVDASTDVDAERSYEQTVVQMLKDKNYDQLDCLADNVRSNKDRLSGGSWKLHLIYSGLDSPVLYPMHATDEDWIAHLKGLRKWTSARPKSITGRVALASAMVSYAWYARGNGLADAVSASGWKLFGERMAEAKRILDGARTLPVECPEWYAVMQDVALAQSWGDAERRALFDKAAKVEPEYYYYYQSYATSILPKWGGEDGDAAKFLQEAADHLGADAGDILYFEVAARLTCGCNDDQNLSLSWARIERGYEALIKQRGASLKNLNLYARVAVKNREAGPASKLFARIGDQWSEDVWRSRGNFESNRKWADQWSPTVTSRSKADADEGNTRYDDYTRFTTAWKEKIAGWMQQCVKENTDDRQKFDLFIILNKEGNIERTIATNRGSAANCLLKKLAEIRQTNSPVVPQPAKPQPGMRFEIDPADFASVASN